MIAPDLARVVFAHGAAAEGGVDAYVPTLSLFGVGILFFTVHYLVLRGFYALELNRTVFFVQCGVAATNIVAAVALVAATDGQAHVARAGGRVRRVVRRRLGRLLPAAAATGSAGCAAAGCWSSAAGWLIATGLATGLTFPVAQVLDGLADDPGLVVAAVRLVAVGAVDVLLFLVFARLLRIEEVSHGGRHADPAIAAPEPALRWVTSGADLETGGEQRCRTRPGPATCSPTGTGWSTCSARAGAAGSGARTTGSSSGTSRCT